MQNEPTHIHFIGAGGIGMSAVAKRFLLLGKEVSGSDIKESDITRDLVVRGAKIFVGHEGRNLAESVDLVLYSSAVPETNPERVAAAERGIRELSYFEYLGELSKEYSTIVVTGTHGKSTTTAMLGLMLEEAGYDPTVIVGSKVSSFPLGNLRVGGGRFLVLEGCEHHANILHLNPEAVLVTNAEFDHPDFYRDVEHLRETFQAFIDKLKGQGIVVLNADDNESKKLTAAKAVRFGTGESAQYRMSERMVSAGSQSATIHQHDQPEALGAIELIIPGSFNMMNALGATAMAMELGVPFASCARVLKSFPGAWRRFERVGTWNGVEVISDYGHHPTAVAATVEAAREFFPERRIILCFQPHQHSRTKELFSEFAHALAAAPAEEIVLTEIYRVAGRTEDESVSSNELIEAVMKINREKSIRYAGDLVSAEQALRTIVQEGDVLLVMGAGDIDQLARKLTK